MKSLFFQNIKIWVRAQLWSKVKLTSRYEVDNRPVFIFASRRGGSTWAMEIFSQKKEFLNIRHPFSVYNVPNYLLSELPIVRCGEFVDPSFHEYQMLKQFLDKIINGKVVFNSKAKFWKPSFSFRPSRLVLKITSAKSLYQELKKSFDFYGIYLTRHPIACALSCSRNNWGTTSPAFLNSRSFLERNNIEASLLEEMQIIEDGDNELKRHVLNWALENLDLVRILKEQKTPLLHLYYEDLVLYPEINLTKIGDYTNTVFSLEEQKNIKKPSGSTKGRSERGFEKVLSDGNKREIANGWQKKVSSEDIKWTYELLEKLGINLYGYHNHDVWKRNL
jgi:hypothetical protein